MRRKRSPVRKKIYILTRINIVLLVIVIICGYIYFSNNSDKRNENGIVGNRTEQAAPGMGDRITGSPKEQASKPAGEVQSNTDNGVPFNINEQAQSNSSGGQQSNPADKEQSGTTGDEQTEDVNPGEELTESLGLALYSDLPYFIEENTERYINYKRQNPGYSHEQVITYVNIGLDYDFYENVNMIENGHDITVLVNKYNKLPDDYKPELVQLDQSMCASGVGPQYLRKEAYEAFVKMRDDAAESGLNITAYGTYRSIQTQHSIWNNAVNSGRTIEDVDSLNARGGHSEHHTGLAIDVIKNNYSVEETDEFKWYSKNAHKYGFIIRYPKGKENITGYKYEPWHLRYVGPEIAKDIYEMDITYDEYYVQVLKPQKNFQDMKQTP